MQPQPQIVLFEPKLLNHEIQHYVQRIDSSPILRALFSLEHVPIPPPLILLTNFGDNSYHYLQGFDELRGGPPQGYPMRRTYLGDEKNDEKELNNPTDDNPLSSSMRNTFKQNSKAFSNFMQNAFQNSFNNKFSPFDSQPNSNARFIPQPPEFPIFYPDIFHPSPPPPPRRFNGFKPQISPMFDMMRKKPSFNGYDYTPPSLIQIGDHNKNTKSSSSNSNQRGIIQINDEVDDETTMDSTTGTEGYETTTMFDNDDRIDPNVIKTLAG
jgi:hypothetical protein